MVDTTSTALVFQWMVMYYITSYIITIKTYN